MKKNYSLLPTLLFISYLSSNAQTDSSTVKRKMKITDLYVATGVVAHTKSLSTLEDFNKLAPQSTLLNDSFAGYSGYSNTLSNNAGFTFSALVGINFLNAAKTAYKSNPQWRLGFSYINGMAMSRTLRKEVKAPYDTLTSSQTGEMIFIDSVTSEYYNMHYQNEQLRLHLSIIFRTNPNARWSLYGGAGINAGMSFNARTEISYTQKKSTENKKTSRDALGVTEYTSESFINNNGFGFAAFIPMGVDWRLGRKREFWKRLHFYYELSPQIDFTSVPELRTFISTGVTSNFGLRVSVQ